METPVAQAVAKERSLEEDLDNIFFGKQQYRDVMFWGRLQMCFGMLGQDADTDALIEDIFSFQKNPESRLAYDIIQANVPADGFVQAGYDFWNVLFEKVPLVFVSMSFRMLLVFQGDHAQSSLTFRMDALYGLQWTLPMLFDAVSKFPPEVQEALADGLVQMFSLLNNMVLQLLQVPEDLPLAGMSQVQADDYQRERDVAAQTLLMIIQAQQQLGIEVALPDDACLYLADNLSLFSADTLPSLMFPIDPVTPAAEHFHRKVLRANLDLLVQACAGDLNFPTAPAADPVPQRESSANSNSEGNKPKARSRSASGGDPDAATFIQYSYWIPEGPEKVNVRKSTYCDPYRIQIIVRVVEAVGALLDVWPKGVLEKWDVLSPVVARLLSFPVLGALRQTAGAILVSSTVPGSLEQLWTAALSGPRSSKTSLDGILAREAFALALETPKPSISPTDILVKVFVDTASEAYISQKSLLDTLNPFRFEVGAIPTSILNCLPTLSDFLNSSKQDRPVNRDVLDVFTDFIKRGGKQLKPHAAKVTAALNALCELPGYELAVYSLGLWLGKFVEGKFGNLVDFTVLFHLCRDSASRCLTRMVAADRNAPELSLPVYTLVRVCLYAFRVDPSLCDGLPEIVFDYLPLPGAAQGDVIAYSTNEYACDLIDSMPAVDQAMGQKFFRFYYLLLANPGLCGEHIITAIKSNPGIMNAIAAAKVATK